MTASAASPGRAPCRWPQSSKHLPRRSACGGGCSWTRPRRLTIQERKSSREIAGDAVEAGDFGNARRGTTRTGPRIGRRFRSCPTNSPRTSRNRDHCLIASRSHSWPIDAEAGLPRGPDGRRSRAVAPPRCPWHIRSRPRRPPASAVGRGWRWRAAPDDVTTRPRACPTLRRVAARRACRRRRDVRRSGWSWSTPDVSAAGPRPRWRHRSGSARSHACGAACAT